VPVVTSEAVHQQIARGRLLPVYLLVGDDDRQISAIATSLSNTIEDELRAFNAERLYATDKGASAAAVVEAARIAPMMAPRRLVTLLRAEAWLKPKRPPAAEAQEDADTQAQAETDVVEKGGLGPLVEYLKSPVESTTLVIVAADVNKSMSAVKALYKTAAVVECWGLADQNPQRGGDGLRQALMLIKETASASGRQFEPAAAQLLAERSGGDIGKLRADVDHALLFAQGRRAITRADVEAVVSDRETVQDPWAVVNAIERGNAPEALRQLAVVLEEGAVPVMVLGQLAWFVREKLPRLRPQQAAAAVQAVFRTDLDLKSSAGDPRVLLERLVLELSGDRRSRRP
jgi:DNA polymerase III delta subunit